MVAPAGGGEGEGPSPSDGRTPPLPPPTLADLDLLALTKILASIPDPRAAAAAAAACSQCARVAPVHGLWRALTVDARGVPDTRAAPRGARAPGAAPSILSAPRARTPRTRAAAAEVTRWLAPGRGVAVEDLSLAWHPAVAASAAVADAALAGCCSGGGRLAAVHLDAGPAGALASLPKPLMSACASPLAHLVITAASMDAGALSNAASGPPPALRSLQSLSIHAALTGWAPLLPPPGRSGVAGWGPAALANLRCLELVGTGLREVPPALADATALTSLALVGARLGRDRWSAAATGASAAWSPTATLGALAGRLQALTLEDCGLETVPAEVGGCDRLGAARLGRNALRSFSCAALAGLPALRLVDLRHNALGAPLPAGLVASWGDGVEVRVEGNPFLKQQQRAAVVGVGRGR